MQDAASCYRKRMAELAPNAIDIKKALHRQKKKKNK